MKTPNNLFLSRLLKTEGQAPRILVEIRCGYPNGDTTLYCSTERLTIGSYEFKEYVLNFGSLLSSVGESEYLAPPNSFSFSMMRNGDTEKLLEAYQKNNLVIVKQWFKDLTSYSEALDLGTFMMNCPSDINLSSFTVNCVSDESEISSDFPKVLINEEEEIYAPCVLGKLWSAWEDNTKRYLDCYLPNTAPAYCTDTDTLRPHLIHQVYGGDAEGINPDRTYQYYPDDGYEFYAYILNYLADYNSITGGLSIAIDFPTEEDQGYARRLRLLPELAISTNDVTDWKNACDLDYNTEAEIGVGKSLALGFNSRNKIARYNPDGLGYGTLGIGWSMRRTQALSPVSKVRAKLQTGPPTRVYDFGVFDSTAVMTYYDTSSVPDIPFQNVLLYDGSTYENETEDAADEGTADVFHSTTSALLKNIGDILYVGMNGKFENCNVILSTVGVGGTVVWEYWRSTPGTGTWVAFTPSGGVYHFSNPAKLVRFPDLPLWVSTRVNNILAYWVRARVTGAFSTAPIGTQININQSKPYVANNFDPADVIISLTREDTNGYPIRIDGFHLIIDYYEDMGYLLRKKIRAIPNYDEFHKVNLVRQPNGYVKTKVNPDIKLENVFGEIKGMVDQSPNYWQTGHPVQIVYAVLKSIAGLPSMPDPASELDEVQMDSIYEEMGTSWEFGRFLENPMNIKELLRDCLQSANLFLFRGADNKFKIVRYNKVKANSDITFTDGDASVYLMKDFCWGFTDSFFNQFNLEFHWDANKNEYREKYTKDRTNDSDLQTVYERYSETEIEYPYVESRWINSLAVMELYYAELKSYWSRLKVWVEFETSLVGCLLELGDTIKIDHSAQVWGVDAKKFQVMSLEQMSNIVRVKATEVIE